MAMHAETVVTTLAWHELERFSNRQQSRINQSGLLGSVTYRGKIPPAILLLFKAGEYCGLGNLLLTGLADID